jgi:hypothetical protein
MGVMAEAAVSARIRATTAGAIAAARGLRARASAVALVAAVVASALGLVAEVAVADPAAAPDSAGATPTPWRRPPVNLRGGYTLERDQVVLSYRFERVGKNGLQSGGSEISPDSVLGAYQSAPETLDLDRHVFTARWSPIDHVTFELELPFVRTVSDQIHQPSPGEVDSFETKSTGFGDVGLWVLYRVYRDVHSDLHLNLGLSFPSGSIGQAQLLPLGATPDALQRLPYPLQLGSGTVDLQPGFTYGGRYDAGAWGFQALAVLRAGTNEYDYILGNEYEVTGWGGWAWNEWLSNSFSLKWRQRFDGSGSDPDIDASASPMADARLLSYRRLDALFGLAITPTGGRLKRTRWVLDAGLPAYQDVDGPQPRTKWLLQFALEITI